MEANPFPYGSPLSPGCGIKRPEELRLLLQMAVSGQNTRIVATRRYGKTTLIEDLREAALEEGLNTVRVDLYGVLTRMDVVLRLEEAYKTLRGPIRRYLNALIPRVRLKASGGMGPAKLEASGPVEIDADRLLIELLDLPVRFFDRTGNRTLVVYDEFQDVLQAEGGIDAIIRSRIQHQREAASYVFAGSHPGMLEELFGNRNRPLYDQAREIRLRPLDPVAISKYVEDRFVETSRSAGQPLTDLVDLAQGHPQRAMMLAHHLWENTGHGERATSQTWQAAVAAVFAELQEQHEMAWSNLSKAERSVLIAAASGESPIASSRLREVGLSKTTSVRARDRLVKAGDLERAEGGGARFIDPLYRSWIASGRRTPAQRPAAATSQSADATPDDSPFGTPDGSRVPLGDLGRTYLALTTATTKNRHRIIVGKKGSGKTFLIRRMYAELAINRSVYVPDIEHAAPRTQDIVRVYQMYPRHVLTEMWSAVARAALLRVTAAHLEILQRRPGVDAELSRSQLLGRHRHHPTLASEITDIVDSHRSPASLTAYLSHPEWIDVERGISDALSSSPPFFLLFDAVDEVFRHAPDAWLAFQKGLVYRVLQMSRDDRWSRLHTVVTVRDIAYASMMSTEHATRYLDNPHVTVLHWTDESIRRLFVEKARTLGSDFLLDPGAGDPIERWLGHTTISTKTRDRVEPITDYLVRHSRLVPRDVVVVGNLLSQVSRRAAASPSPVSEQTLHRTVASAAHIFGREQLAIAANHIASETSRWSDPTREDVYGRVDGLSETPSPSYYGFVQDKLLAALRNLAADRFQKASLKTLQHELDEAFGRVDALGILWQNGLLGYVEDGDSYGPAHFFDAITDDLSLPDGTEFYVLHPILIDVLG